MLRPIVAGFKFFLFAALIVVVVPPQILIMLFTKGPISRILPMLWMRWVCMVFGIRVCKQGTPYRDGQVISMCNHLSYLDIPVVGSVIPDSFVSKSDVAKWKLFGFLAGLRQTAYVIRGSVDPIVASQGVEKRLAEGDNLIIYPEGTSTDGQEVLEFKRGVFARAIDAQIENLKIQPVTLSVTNVDGHPNETQDDRDLYAWHNGMDDDFELQHHLWKFAQSKGADIKLIFHEPIAVKDYNDRKILAKDTHKAVSMGLQNSIQKIAA